MPTRVSRTTPAFLFQFGTVVSICILCTFCAKQELKESEVTGTIEPLQVAEASPALRLTNGRWKAVLGWAEQYARDGADLGIDTSKLPKAACTVLYVSGTITNDSSRVIPEVFVRVRVGGPDSAILEVKDHELLFRNMRGNKEIREPSLEPGASKDFSFRIFLATKHVTVAGVSAAALETQSP